MVFMKDSERGAEKGLECGIDTGLHLNLSQLYDGGTASSALAESQARIVRFMKSSKYAVLLYHPGLRKTFRDVFKAQWDEFIRLYGKPPTHVDGHQHRHLCANVLVDEVIPRGQKVRRNFSFFPGDKSAANRIYRRFIDYLLARRYRLTDYFFSLPQCLKKDRLSQVIDISMAFKVELMTHPTNGDEYAFLMGDGYLDLFRGLETASYSLV